jgi:hypothetical protein
MARHLAALDKRATVGIPGTPYARPVRSAPALDERAVQVTWPQELGKRDAVGKGLHVR